MIKKIIFSVMILMSLGKLAYSSWTTIWTQRYDSDGGGDDYAYGIAVYAAGYVYVTGYGGSADYDYVTIKYDSAGNIIWTQSCSSGINDAAYGIAVDTSGYVYVTGKFDSANYDYGTIKYDGNGNSKWTQRYNSGAHDIANGIAVDNNGYVYVTGETSSNSVTIKYDSTGNSIWTQRYDGGVGGIDAASYGIAVDTTGYVYITGKFWNGTNYDYYTIKYNSSGNTIWTQRYDSGGNDYAYGIAVDTAGYVYVTGCLYDGTNCDYFTIKYDSSGNTIWTQRYNSGNHDFAYGIAVDNNGYVYVTGESYNGTDYDYVTIKYESSGNTIWTQRYDGGGGDKAHGIAVDNNGYVYVTGYSYNGSNYDYFTIKYEQEPYPSEPAGLSAAEKTGYIEIKWSDNTINERGFKIYRSYDSINYEVIGRVGAGVTVYDDTGYNTDRTNWYKVSATNLSGEIESSSVKWEKIEAEEVMESVSAYGIDKVVAVPNPFKLSAGGEITFYNVPENIRIEIYRVTGEKIIELISGSGGNIKWGAVDKYGRKLGTGLYVGKIKDATGNEKYIKILIAR